MGGRWSRESTSARHLVEAVLPQVQLALQFEPTAVPAQLSGHEPLDSGRLGLAGQITAAGQAGGTGHTGHRQPLDAMK